MQHELETERVPTDSLLPYPGNPREGDIGAIAVSLEQNGQFRPIVVNRRDMTILAGNHTWKAAKYLGWSDIAVTFVDVDEQQARKIVLADNRHNDLATFDNVLLAEMLRSIAEEDTAMLLGTGYDGDDLDTLLLDLERENASSFLDGLMTETEEKKNEIELPAAGEEWVTLSYVMLPQDRESVFEAIKHARNFYSINTNGEALAVVCRKYLEKMQ